MEIIVTVLVCPQAQLKGKTSLVPQLLSHPRKFCLRLAHWPATIFLLFLNNMPSRVKPISEINCVCSITRSCSSGLQVPQNCCLYSESSVRTGEGNGVC